MSRPSVRFDHLARMTDDTGILEHALGMVPRRKEGYSTDDQARALWACLEWMDLSGSREKRLLERLAETYLAFLLWAQEDNGHFHNNFAYDRSKDPESPSDDCIGRCLWACAKVMTRHPAPACAFTAEAIFVKALDQAGRITHPRGLAYALAAFGLLERFGFDVDLSSVMMAMAGSLAGYYRKHSAPGWHWYGSEITYSNALLPWGMLWAYERGGQREWLEIAKGSLDFLIRLSLNEAGQIRPVGNRGWCRFDSRAQWDQQPIDVMKLALAADKAYELTGVEEYADIVLKCREWFHGGNDLGVPIVNERDGSCFDGLQENGPNQNCGAEAVISYLLTEAIWRNMTNRKSRSVPAAVGR